MLAVLVVVVEAADHHILYCLGQLSPYCMYDFRLNGRVVGYQPAKQPPVGAAQVENSRRFGPVVPQQVLDTDWGYAELHSSIAELAEIGGFPTR
jgi:hypothetical protein